MNRIVHMPCATKEPTYSIIFQPKKRANMEFFFKAHIVGKVNVNFRFWLRNHMSLFVCMCVCVLGALMLHNIIKLIVNAFQWSFYSVILLKKYILHWIYLPWPFFPYMSVICVCENAWICQTIGFNISVFFSFSYTIHV